MPSGDSQVCASVTAKVLDAKVAYDHPPRQLRTVSLASGHPYQGVVILVLLSDWQPGGGGTVMVGTACWPYIPAVYVRLGQHRMNYI